MGYQLFRNNHFLKKESRQNIIFLNKNVSMVMFEFVLYDAVRMFTHAHSYNYFRLSQMLSTISLLMARLSLLFFTVKFYAASLFSVME